MAYPCDTTPLQNQQQHLNLGLSHQDPTQPLTTRRCEPVHRLHLQAVVTLKPFAEAG